jgi:hypothetical protein
MLKELVLLAIGAIFGPGATMSALAAPAYFPNAPSWAWHWLFWGGIALMTLVAIDGISLIILKPSGPTALLMNAGIVLFSAALINHFSAKSVPTDVSIAPSVVLLMQGDQLRLFNNSKFDIQLYGDKFGNEAPNMDQPRVIPASHHYYFITDRLEAIARLRLGVNGSELVPFEAYLAAHNKHYTAKFYLLIKMTNSVMSVHTQQLDISDGGW